VTVFLRWGIFGILGVAALVYAYNASKRLAETHALRPAPTATAGAPQVAARVSANESRDAPPSAPPSAPAAAPPPAAAPHCEAELVVAQRAIEMRKQGAPLDRVLRIQEIAWQESAPRRQRLAQVATRWFGYQGDFRPELLRMAVINDCVEHSPPP
jgi:hypothetical protein